MSCLVFDLKNKTIQHQKKWINEGKNLSLLIKNCVVDKKCRQKAINNAVFRVLLKYTLNAETKNNLLPSYKVKYKRKTHFFKRSIVWYLHWKKVTNKKLVKVCQSILQRINKMHLKPG